MIGPAQAPQQAGNDPGGHEHVDGRQLRRIERATLWADDAVHEVVCAGAGARTFSVPRTALPAATTYDAEVMVAFVDVRGEVVHRRVVDR